MNRKGNMIVVILMVIVVMGVGLMIATYSPIKEVLRDRTGQAAVESSLALRKSVFVGVGESMQQGLSPISKAWYCNRPLPPSYSEANISLRNSTSDLLNRYFDGFRRNGYHESFGNISYSIAFPLNDSAIVRIPGYSVVVTDLSGSMSFLMDGRRKDSIVREMNKVLLNTTFSLSPGAKIGLVTYADDSDWRHLISDDHGSLTATIDTMEAPGNGATCIACGIYKAVEMLVPPPVPGTYSQERPLSVVLMSDGGANRCFDQGSITDECLVLDYPIDAGCSRIEAKAQAVEYARQAHELYGIDFYTVIFATDDCPSGVDPSDCYDPDTMRNIAQAGGNVSNFAEGWDADQLKDIYERYGTAVARYLIRNLTYLRLENDRIYASIANATAGMNRTELRTTRDISDMIEWDFRTWWMYKNLVTWDMRYAGSELLELPEIKSALTSYLPCQAVFYDAAGCPPQGEVYGAFNESFRRMQITNADMRPLQLKQDIENSLAQHLNSTNITCDVEILSINASNEPVFDFRGAPVNLQVNFPFGNGTYRQSSTDQLNLRMECPEREDFLGILSRYPLGRIGANSPVNPVCSAATPYQYVGVDHMYSLEILVRCQDPTIGAVTDSRTNFEPLTLEFTLMIDMMSDCDPPEDSIADEVTC